MYLEYLRTSNFLLQIAQLQTMVLFLLRPQDTSQDIKAIVIHQPVDDLSTETYQPVDDLTIQNINR